MIQLELVIKFLKKKAIPVENINNKYLNQFVMILPLPEVVDVLEMVESGDFEDFYNNWEKGTSSSMHCEMDNKITP